MAISHQFMYEKGLHLTWLYKSIHPSFPKHILLFSSNITLSLYITILPPSLFRLFSLSTKWLKKPSQSPNTKNMTSFDRTARRALGDVWLIKWLISLTHHSNLVLTISSLKCIIIQVIAANTFFLTLLCPLYVHTNRTKLNLFCDWRVH